MLKETITEKTVVFFVTFLSLVAFQLGGGGLALWPPPGYAYAPNQKSWLRLCSSVSKMLSFVEIKFATNLLRILSMDNKLNFHHNIMYLQKVVFSFMKAPYFDQIICGV